MKKLISGICILISGLGTGWLVGLSVSPIVHLVIGTLLSLLLALISALAGIETAETDVDQEQSIKKKITALRKVRSINPLPVTVFIVGLAMGSSLGVYARTNEWLGMNIQAAKQRWGQLGFDDKEIRALYLRGKISYQGLKPTSKEEGIKGEGISQAGVLFATTAEVCEQIRLIDTAYLKQKLISLDEERIDKYIQKCSTDICLDALRDYLCSK